MSVHTKNNQSKDTLLNRSHQQEEFEKFKKLQLSQLSKSQGLSSKSNNSQSRYFYINQYIEFQC